MIQKRETKVVLLGVLGLLCVIIIMFGLKNLRNSSESSVPISDEDVRKITDSLVLLDYKNNFRELIDGLPEYITAGAKSDLLDRTLVKYENNNKHGSIKDVLVGINSIGKTMESSENSTVLTVNYNENNLFKSPMTTIIKLEWKNKECVKIEVNNFSNGKQVLVD